MKPQTHLEKNPNMLAPDKFYIGYLPKAPVPVARLLLLVVS